MGPQRELVWLASKRLPARLPGRWPSSARLTATQSWPGRFPDRAPNHSQTPQLQPNSWHPPERLWTAQGLCLPARLAAARQTGHQTGRLPTWFAHIRQRRQPAPPPYPRPPGYSLLFYWKIRFAPFYLFNCKQGLPELSGSFRPVHFKVIVTTAICCSHSNCSFPVLGPVADSVIL